MGSLLSITINVNQGPAPAPLFVSPQDVVKRAQAASVKAAALALAYTDPIITIDLTQLGFSKRQGPKGLQFSLNNSGSLGLTLKQEMLVSNTLSQCARQKWVNHENGHVRDNQAVMGQMAPAIRNDHALSSMFTKQTWYDLNAFRGLTTVNGTIFNAIAAIFRRLTAQAVAARDTRAEYERVHRDVLQNCPEPYIYETISGDTLSRIAEFFYGRASAWQSIHQANRKTIGDNPDLIRPGQQLLIPRKP